MTLFDSFGRPIEPTLNRRLKAKRLIEKTVRQLRERWQSLWLFWKILIGFLAIAGTLATLYWGLYEFRQDISVDPYISYDSSDPFNQRSSITNNGPFSIYDVRYACAVTYLEPNIFDPRAEMVMMPVANPIPVLRWKGKTSTDCDFIARLGPNLRAVHIEIEVLYHRWPYPWTFRGPGWKFSAKTDKTGRFIWDYGSPDDGIFEGKGRVLILQSFDSDCAAFDPKLAFDNFLEFSLMAKKFGHTIIAATLPDCGKPK